MTLNLMAIMGLGLTKIALHLLNFIILLVIAGFLIYKPMMKLIRTRRENAQKLVEDHEAKLKEAADTKAQYEALLSDAEKEIAIKKAEAAKEIAERSEEELAAAKHKANVILEQAAAEVETEKIRAVHAVKGEIVEAAVMIANGILAKEISVEEDKKIIDDCLKEWSEQ